MSDKIIEDYITSMFEYEDESEYLGEHLGEEGFDYLSFHVEDSWNTTSPIRD